MNSKGIVALMKSKEVSDFCDSKAKSIVNKLGDGYSSDTRLGRKRSVTVIKTTTNSAYKDALNNDTLAKAVFNGNH